jgi:hypothetical protein
MSKSEEICSESKSAASRGIFLIDARCRHNPGWQPLGYLGSPLLCLQSGETIDPEKRRKYIRKANLTTGSISALVRKKPLSGSSAVTEIWPLVAVFWDIHPTASIKVLVKEQYM